MSTDTIKHITINLDKKKSINFIEPIKENQPPPQPSPQPQPPPPVLDGGNKKKDEIRIKNTQNYKHLTVSNIPNLEGCIETDVEDIPLGTYCKFISLKNNAEVFNHGGLLKRRTDTYCLLMKGTYFFKISRHVFNKKGGKIYSTRFFVHPNNIANNSKTLNVQKLDYTSSDDESSSDHEQKAGALNNTFSSRMKSIDYFDDNENDIKKRSIRILKQELLKLSKGKIIK